MSSDEGARVRVAPADDVRASRAVAAVAVACAGVLLAGVAVSARGPAPEDVPTTLVEAAAGTTLEVPGSAPRVVGEGTRVPDGAIVRTPADGDAVLATGDREVHLAGATHLRVLDGTRQALDAGSVLVDADDGPRVRVAAGGADVRVPDQAVVRLDRGAVLRVASYGGTAVLRADGRTKRASVPALHQVQVPYGALPGRVTPLALTPADRWEQEQVPEVVETDAALSGLVLDLDGTPLGARAVSFVPATFRSVLTDTDSPLGTGARTMTFAIAQASGDPAGTYRQVLDGRELGGSWGVLSELVEAEPADVLGFFDEALPDAFDAVARDQAEAAAAERAAEDAAVLAGLLSPALPADVGGPQPTRSPRPSSGPSPRPVPSPLPEDPEDVPGELPDEVEEPAEQTLREVIAMIPSPSPSPSPPPVLRLPTQQQPAPVPSPSSRAASPLPAVPLLPLPR